MTGRVYPFRDSGRQPFDLEGDDDRTPERRERGGDEHRSERARKIASGFGPNADKVVSSFEKRIDDITDDFADNSLSGSKASLRAFIEMLNELIVIADKAFRSLPTKSNSESLNSLISQQRASAEELRALEDGGRIGDAVETLLTSGLDRVAREIGNELIKLRDNLHRDDHRYVTDVRTRILEVVGEAQAAMLKAAEDL